ncbi:MAG: hypothetical protein A2X49_08760 [Lentisphaerae bacterium GWF2_52_8]|nr:MAG: hypothetical protein A2X49_08760 [Lentisphaerae bacterium GWF2_52_8]
MAKKSSSGTFGTVFLFLILPLIAVNAYAYYRLSAAAKNWTLSIIPISLSDTLTQLAVILALNNLVIVFLLLYLAARRK